MWNKMDRDLASFLLSFQQICLKNIKTDSILKTRGFYI